MLNCYNIVKAKVHAGSLSNQRIYIKKIYLDFSLSMRTPLPTVLKILNCWKLTEYSGKLQLHIYSVCNGITSQSMELQACSDSSWQFFDDFRKAITNRILSRIQTSSEEIQIALVTTLIHKAVENSLSRLFCLHHLTLKLTEMRLSLVKIIRKKAKS